MKYSKLFFIFLLVFLLSACSDAVRFKAGDKKDDFCGAFINFQYCKCANHGEYCENIGMSRGEAKDYVNEEYDKWVESEKEDFAKECFNDNGIYKNGKCTYCDKDEVVQNDKCIKKEDSDSSSNEENKDGDEGVCKYDSDCAPICEANIAWKMGCNPRENICEKTFDINCSDSVETFSSLSFPKICSEGICIRDEKAISEMKSKLEAEKKLWSDTVKAINATRDDLNIAMLEANKNCINGIADMTNVAIMEFSTRVASVLAGGIPDVAKMAATASEHAAGLMAENMKNLAGAAVDYAGFSLDKLYNYQSGEPAEEEKKLKPDEYIKLNCDLYNYFKSAIAESDTELDLALQEARRVDSQLGGLPN